MARDIIMNVTCKKSFETLWRNERTVARTAAPEGEDRETVRRKLQSLGNECTNLLFAAARETFALASAQPNTEDDCTALGLSLKLTAGPDSGESYGSTFAIAEVETSAMVPSQGARETMATALDRVDAALATLLTGLLRANNLVQEPLPIVPLSAVEGAVKAFANRDRAEAYLRVVQSAVAAQETAQDAAILAQHKLKELLAKQGEAVTAQVGENVKAALGLTTNSDDEDHGTFVIDTHAPAGGSA